jgi:hypothetical protein
VLDAADVAVQSGFYPPFYPQMPAQQAMPPNGVYANGAGYMVPMYPGYHPAMLPIYGGGQMGLPAYDSLAVPPHGADVTSRNRQTDCFEGGVGKLEAAGAARERFEDGWVAAGPMGAARSCCQISETGIQCPILRARLDQRYPIGFSDAFLWSPLDRVASMAGATIAWSPGGVGRPRASPSLD